MGVQYFKRFRMEIDLGKLKVPKRSVPPGYRLVGWDESLLDVHAEMKFQSFRSEVDASVFPCFNERSSCLRLMDEIAAKSGFLPAATWLVEYVGAGPRRREFCGTIQGIEDAGCYGAIQNLGVVPHHRGRGLATCLMYRALDGFARSMLSRAYLEVTAQNRAAVKLYQKVGFRRARTLYKAVEVAYT